MKALFINFSTAIYGSAKSLSLLLKNYRGADFCLVLPKKGLFGRNSREWELLEKRFGLARTAMKECYLPYDPCFEGRPRGIGKLIRGAGTNFLWKLTRQGFCKWLANERHDFIHLNSIVLNPVITKGFPFIIHIREMYDNSSPQAVERIGKAAGIIFIDTSTERRLLPLLKDAPPYVLLNNPVDMTQPGADGKEHPCRPQLPASAERSIVISVIGYVDEVKGVDFIIRAFRRLKSRDRILVIAGSYKSAYGAYCRKIAEGDDRIFFAGEVEAIHELYGVSDYVVRGDPTFRVGRTVFEGLYSGCEVIIPGSSEDISGNPYLSEYVQSIHMYKPRSADDLVRVLESACCHKMTVRAYRSNIGKYTRDFHDFASRIAGGLQDAATH